MADVDSAGKTEEIGEIEVIRRNKRTGEIKYHEVLPVYKECDA